eukprot:scaffold6767_cov223-Isochrysis_galbana.AAC.6
MQHGRGASGAPPVHAAPQPEESSRRPRTRRSGGGTRACAGSTGSGQPMRAHASDAGGPVARVPTPAARGQRCAREPGASRRAGARWIESRRRRKRRGPSASGRFVRAPSPRCPPPPAQPYAGSAGRRRGVQRLAPVYWRRATPRATLLSPLRAMPIVSAPPYRLRARASGVR